MALLDELSERLYNRFKDVPGVASEDTDEWIETGMNEHGFEREDNVPAEYVPIIMLHAEADGASQIAVRSAHFFKYSDKDESVDKSGVADRYRRLAEILWDRYRRKRFEGVGEIGGSRVHIMTRVDR
jgi:hypothetical protein